MSVTGLSVFLVLAMSGSAIASPMPDAAAMARDAQMLLEHVASADGPGVAMLIARGDTVIFRGARGRAEIELGVPLTPDHVFRIASVTKTFTAALVLKLAEEGKLSLDDHLSKYLPDFPNGEHIALRQLMNHTAGISDVSTNPHPGWVRREITRGSRLEELRNRPADFPPGTSWRYSNSGYILLGMVIETVTGEPWHVAMQKRLLTPLGLTHTRYGDGAPLMPGRVAGYTTDTPEHIVNNAEYISAAIPDSAGALVSTVDDLLRWTRALVTGRVITHDSYQQMITPAPVDSTNAAAGPRYGLGVFIWSVRGSTMIGHTGQIPGFASVVGYLPQQDLTVIALGNDDDFDARTTGRRLAAIAMGTPYPAVVPVPATETQLQALVGTYRVTNTTTRTLFVKDKVLYAQRSGGHAIPLQLTANGELHFNTDDLSYFVPVRDTTGRVLRLDYFPDGEAPPQALPRLETPSP
jgi:D-alanyl-D-alanine carboxypeptidase